MVLVSRVSHVSLEMSFANLGVAFPAKLRYIARCRFWIDGRRSLKIREGRDYQPVNSRHS